MTPAQFAERAMAITLEHEAKYLVDYAKAMGAFVVRFSGDKLAHAGKALDAALDRIFAMTKRPVTFRGYLHKGAKTTRYATPRKLDAAGRKLVTAALATLKTMPKQAAMAYFHDGTKTDGLVPGDFAAYFSLVKDAGNTFATGKGYLAVALPMASLTDPKWRALVDELVVLLAAEVAFMGPAIWLAPHNLFNSTLNQFESGNGCVALWGAHPQIEIPSMLSSRWPHDFDEYEPSAFGLLAPSWIMWLGPALAKKVKAYGGESAKLHGGATRYHASADPFVMNEAVYAAWKARWAELAPAHVTNPSEATAAKYYRERFVAKTFAALHADWKAALDVASAKQNREYAISRELQELANKQDPKLLSYAESVAKEMTSSHAWYFLPGLRDLLESGKAKREEATVWLDLCEQLDDTQILPKAAAVAAAAGEVDRGIDLLRRAIKAGRANPKHVAKDPDYKPLRKHPQWKKLTGSDRPRS